MTSETLNLVLSVIGAVLGVVSLWIAVWQLRKTASAAQAAKDASQRTEARVKELGAVIEVSRLRASSHQLVILIRSDNLRAAAQRALDLREAAATARYSPGTSSLLQPAEWQAVLVNIAGLHDALESTARKKKAEVAGIDGLLVEAARIHEILSQAVGTAAASIHS